MEKNDQKGFTLVEIIATLILVGILASIAGMGIVQATRSYLFSRDASAMAQKAQAAYARMGRTFLNISDIDVSGGSTATRLRVTIERNHVDVVETYVFTGISMTLQAGGNTDLLLDKLTNASGFSYLQTDGTPWTPSNAKTALSRIQVNLAMDSPGSQAVGFSSSFVPRNIYRPEQMLGFLSGGSAMPSGGCFISTTMHEKTGLNFVLYLLAGGGILVLVSAARRGNEG